MFPSRSKLPFTTDGGADSHTVTEQFPSEEGNLPRDGKYE